MNFPQKVIIDRANPNDKYGQCTYTTTYEMARVEMRQVSFRTTEGLDLISNGIAYVKDDIKNGDRIHYKNKQYIVRLVYDTIDLAGNHQFMKVWLI